MTVPMVQLGDVCKIVMGQSPPSTTYNASGGELPFFQGKGDFGEMFPNARIFCNKPLRIAEPGDIPISVRAPVGPTNLNREKCCIGRGLSALRPMEELDTQFLLFYLRYYEPRLAQQGLGSTFQAINRDDLENVPIPSLPLSEQKQIAQRLARADRQRRMRRYALQVFDHFLPAIFLEMFGDPVKNEQHLAIAALKSASQKITDGEHLNPEFVTKGLPIVMAEQVEDAGVNLSSCKFVSSQDFIKFVKKCEPKKNDILLVSRGATIGRTCVVNTQKPFCLMGSVILIKPDDAVVNPFFLAAQLKSNSFLAVLRTTSGASAQQAIYIADLKDKPIIVPPLPLQRKFAEIVHRHERMRSVQHEALRQADHLFESLLDQAFAA